MRLVSEIVVREYVYLEPRRRRIGVDIIHRQVKDVQKASPPCRAAAFCYVAPALCAADALQIILHGAGGLDAPVLGDKGIDVLREYFFLGRSHGNAPFRYFAVR